MARPSNLTEEMFEMAQAMVKQAENVRQMRTGLSVVIPVCCGVTNSVTAHILGISVATVIRMQNRIRNQLSGKTQKENAWGGRRHQLLSVNQEEHFLRPWKDKYNSLNELPVFEIQAALERRIGRHIPKSTVYRMLARHGWKKKPTTR